MFINKTDMVYNELGQLHYIQRITQKGITIPNFHCGPYTIAV